MAGASKLAWPSSTTPIVAIMHHAIDQGREKKSRNTLARCGSTDKEARGYGEKKFRFSLTTFPEQVARTCKGDRGGVCDTLQSRIETRTLQKSFERHPGSRSSTMRDFRAPKKSVL